MTDTKKNVFYKLRYDVISYSPQGLPMQVCYHGMDMAGFTSPEAAQQIVEKLEEGNKACNKNHIYDIIPVLVSEDYGKAPEVTINMEGDDQDFMEESSEEKQEPPQSN